MAARHSSGQGGVLVPACGASAEAPIPEDVQDVASGQRGTSAPALDLPTVFLLLALYSVIGCTTIGGGYQVTCDGLVGLCGDVWHYGMMVARHAAGHHDARRVRRRRKGGERQGASTRARRRRPRAAYGRHQGRVIYRARVVRGRRHAQVRGHGWIRRRHHLLGPPGAYPLRARRGAEHARVRAARGRGGLRPASSFYGQPRMWDPGAVEACDNVGSEPCGDGGRCYAGENGEDYVAAGRQPPSPGATRYGEADHPGPEPTTSSRTGSRTDPPFEARPRLRHALRPDLGVLSYPHPREGGVEHFVAPGHPTRLDGHGQDEFRLVIESVNATGIRSTKRRLRDSDAHVLLVQETRAMDDRCAAMSAWALRRGWKSLWAPAEKGKGGGPSAGVAIFVRSYLGLRHPQAAGYIWCPARAVAGVVEAPGHRPLLVASLYLRHGIGAGPDNLAILDNVAQAIDAQEGEWGTVVGGDFNMEPGELAGSGVDREMGASIIFPDTARGTFRTSTASSLLDYFMVADRLSAAVEGVGTIEGTGVKGHVPVKMVFKPRVTSLKALHLRQPPALPPERVYGPLPPPPAWAQAKAAACEALAAARNGSDDADCLLERAYKLWADTAEDELEGCTGANLRKKGTRGLRPRVVWRSVIPERPPPSKYPRLAAIQFLRAIVMELQRIGTHAIVLAAGDAAENQPRATVGGPGHGDRDGQSHAEDDPVDGDGAGRDGVDAYPGPADPDDDDDEDDGEPMGIDWRRPVHIDLCRRTVAELHRSLCSDMPAGDTPADIKELFDQIDVVVRRAAGVIGAEVGDEGDRAAQGDRRATHPPGQLGWCTVRRDDLVACGADIVKLRTDLDAMGRAADHQDRREEEAGWTRWVNDGVNAGARNAHAYSRLPDEWRPTVAAVEGGLMSAAPEAILNEVREKHRRQWKPADGPIQYAWSNRDELPGLTVEELRQASASFRVRTAVTYDGLHPKHIALLCDEGVETLATLYAAVEFAGSWPRQVALVVAALLPKVAGGFRSIGLMPAVYRVWAKARRKLSDAWELRHTRPYLAAAKGNGAIDTMWRLGTRQEADVGEGLQAAVIAEDLKAFFECIGRERLAAEAEALGYPMALIRAAFGAYAHARVMTLQGRIARELYPTRGVVAGCCLAMALTKVFYVRSFDTFVARAPPGIVLDAYVDDITLSMTGNGRTVVIELTRAHEQLTELVRGDLDCEFAPGKTAVTATTKEIATAVARAVGADTEPRRSQCLLGVDNTGGARRAVLKRNSKKGARLKAALRRRRRLEHLHNVVGRGAAKVFRTGIIPSAAYDAAVWGLDDAEARRLRRLAAAAMAPRGRGRSLRMVHMWYSHPTADAETAPVVQYARMVWRAVTNQEDARSRGASLADIRRMWSAADAYIAPILRDLAAHRAREGSISIRTSREAWGRIRGPIGAAALSLERIGWTFVDPFTVRDERGATFQLTTNAPALIRDHLRHAVRRADERALAAKWAPTDEQFAGRRACLDLAILHSRAGKRLTPKQAGAFKAAACGALMTAERAQRLGYLTDGLCPLCKRARDTVPHRVYGCEHTEATVRAAVPDWFWKEAQRNAAADSFWTTAVFPHPADLAPSPTKERYVQVEVFPEKERASADALAVARRNGLDDLAGVDDRTADLKAQLGGNVYFDGSCTTSPIRDLTRAACSIVEVDEAGDPIRTVEATVPWDLPQTAQCAEHLAMAMGYHYVARQACFVGDCLNVVRAMDGKSRTALAATSRYAGLVLATHSNPARRRLVGEVRWTRAHRTATGHEDAREALDIRANALADDLAKAAVKLHAPLGPHVDSLVAFYTRRAPHVVKAVAVALECFPPAPRDLPRVPPPADESQARARRQHNWQFRAGAWRCTICRDWLNARRLPPYRRRQRCSGAVIDDAAAAIAQRGHNLCRASSEMPFILCTSCGSWGHRRARGLLGPCGLPTRAGQQAIKRVAAGSHPLLRKSGAGGALARDRITVTHVFSRDQSLWVPVVDGGGGGEDLERRDHGMTGGGDAPPAAEGLAGRPLPHAGADHDDMHGGGDELAHDGGKPSGEAAAGSSAPEGHGCRPGGPVVDAADGDAQTAPAETAREGHWQPRTSLSRRAVGMVRAEVDFTARAVENLAAPLRQGARDAHERLAQLRQRVLGRLARNRDAPGLHVRDAIDSEHVADSPSRGEPAAKRMRTGAFLEAPGSVSPDLGARGEGGIAVGPSGAMEDVEAHCSALSAGAASCGSGGGGHPLGPHGHRLLPAHRLDAQARGGGSPVGRRAPLQRHDDSPARRLCDAPRLHSRGGDCSPAGAREAKRQRIATSGTSSRSPPRPTLLSIVSHSFRFGEGDPSEQSGIGAAKAAAAALSETVDPRRCPAPPRPANSDADRRALVLALMDCAGATAGGAACRPPGAISAADADVAGDAIRGAKRRAGDDAARRSSVASVIEVAKRSCTDARTSTSGDPTSCGTSSTGPTERGHWPNSESASCAHGGVVHDLGGNDPIRGQRGELLLGTRASIEGRRVATSSSSSGTARRAEGVGTDSRAASMASPGGQAAAGGAAIVGRRLRGKQAPPHLKPPD